MISVIIPYNKDRGYLIQAINSVQTQIYRDVEIILSYSDKSVGYNINRGIEKARGEYVCFLCDDDTLPPNSLQDRLEAIKDFDFIHGRSMQFNENGDIKEWPLTDRRTNLKKMLNQNGIMGGTVLYRKSLFDSFKWDEELWTGEEYDVNLYLLKNGFKLGFCNSFVYNYRRHSEQKSLGNKDFKYQNARRIEVERIRSRYA